MSHFQKFFLEGKTLVAFEAVDGGYVSIEHFDLDDVQQNLHVPKIRTQAKDKETGDEVGKNVGTFVDTITYENVLPNLEYNMSGELMFKEDGKSSGQKGDKNFTAQAGEDPDRADGSITVEIPLSLSKEQLEGKSLVAFEELKVLANQEDGKPKSDTTVAEHKDIKDASQTVNYPKIRTLAVDEFTSDHVGSVTKTVKVKDTIEYWNLVAGKSYTIKGTLYDVDGTLLATAPAMEFTATEADAAHGTKVIEFPIDSSALAGHTVVVYEKLLHNDVEITQHEENNDETQRVHYPWMKTTAVDANTKDHVGTILGKLVNTFRRLTGEEVEDTEYQKVIDTVEYKNTIPSESYTFYGTLMNKETGKEILGDDGKPITASATIEANQHPADGSVEIKFSVDSSKLTNATIVCYEKMMHKDVEVNRHEDLGDEEQSVHDVEIRTVALDKSTGKHIGNAMKATPVEDTVEMKNLVAGMEYKLVGTLYDKETGQPVVDANGKPYTAEKTFTASGSGDSKRVDMSEVLTFDIDSTKLAGKTVVAYEDLYHNDVRIATHSDISDEDQSVHYPGISTTLADNKNGAKETQAKSVTEVVDKVDYKNLLPGKYKLSGVLMDKTTNSELLNADGSKVTQELVFTITSQDEGKAGYKELVFTLDSSNLAGHVAVAFETLILLDEGDDTYEVPVAEHTDINDEKQSEWIIDIGTHLSDVMTNSDEGEARETAEWNDHVSYTGLIPGKEYTMKGTLMDKATNEPFIDTDGKMVTATATFTPEKADGFVDLKFHANTKGLAGHTVVAFEELYPSDMPDTVVAEHKDINDEAQTVDIIEIRTHATDKATNLNEGAPAKESTIIDRVTYVNLKVGREYILKARMMDKKTGEALIVDGKEITQSVKFTPETRDGFVDVVFTVDTSKLAGETMVAYEQLFNAEFEDVVIAHHEDINDDEQAIHIPKIRTVLKDKLSNDHIMFAGEKVTVVDTIDYENLVPGREHTFRGTLMDKETNSPLMENGQPVTAEKTFTPAEPNGFETLEFTFNASTLGNKTVVAFEECYVKSTFVKENENPEVPAEEYTEEVLVAEHKDITDEDQSVHIPSVITIAELKGKNVVDDVTYYNLTPGKYIAKGWLVDKKTGKKLKKSDGEKAFSLSEYTPEGAVTVKLPVNGIELLGGYDLVAFEEIYAVTEDENGETIETLVAEHKDVEDEDQTVKIPKPPKTGDNFTIFYIGGVFLLSAGLYFIIRRRKQLK